MRATAARLSAIQIDSVNVLARAHYLPTFSRHGPYPMPALDDLVHGRRELFEYWGHAACFLPIDLYPLMRWRMDNQLQAWTRLPAKQKAFNEAVYREIAERGALTASEISIAGKSTGPWWGWSAGKEAAELLFRQGRLLVAGRRHFERLYDIPERVVPKPVLDAAPVAPSDAKKALIVRAARAMGVGTARDIAQYFHIDAWWDRRWVHGLRKPVNTHALFDELVEEGRLERIAVEDWKRPAFVVPGVKIPRTVDARAVVSPFDPVLWERKWTKAVFGFDYQIEIYVPGPKRIYGYYVLPFLFGDRFAARVDLKADRKTSTLIVHAAYVEAGVDSGAVASALAGEIRQVAAWLSLDAFAVGSKGNLARPLKRALR
ncbi:MAG TPA: crosslink repair DNA glycosylase YcaQ family protein [Vicinamibacterales bacterium]|nr:crosslink repair DNA glycosylase YcaQ family protein [Vicinamibacterales bacterium]